MKTLVCVGVCALLATAAFGQRHGGAVGVGGFRGGGGFVHGGMGGGFSRGGFGFGVRAPGRIGVGRGFGFRPGFGFGIGARRFGFNRGFYGGFGYGAWLPFYSYPFMGFDSSDYWLNPYPYVWANPYPYSGYGYGYTAGPNVTVIAPYAPEPAQPAVTQVYVPERAHPVMREFNELPQAGGSLMYLIAFKDHGQVIRAALAYWVEGSTLHYLDLDHKEKQAPLDSIDAAFSEQLNRERRVPFHLPDTQ